MMLEGDGQVGSRGRLAPPICAITAARHVASIPPPITAEVSADIHQDALSDNMQQGLPERLSFGVLRSAFRIPLNAKQRSIRRSRDLSLLIQTRCFVVMLHALIPSSFSAADFAGVVIAAIRSVVCIHDCDFTRNYSSS